MMCAAFRKDIVENNYMLDIGEFVGRGILTPGEIKVGKLALDENFEFHLTSDLTPIDRGVVMIELAPNVSQRIDIVTSEPNFGGYRYWFQCPETYKKCTKLYYDFNSGDFVSREALGLGYRSQRLNMKSRYAERAKDIRLKLGGEPNLIAPLPKKPHNMHAKTYGTLIQKVINGQNAYFNL